MLLYVRNKKKNGAMLLLSHKKTKVFCFNPILLLLLNVSLLGFC